MSDQDVIDLEKAIDRIRNPDVIECKGIFYRFSSSVYLSSHDSIEVRESYRLLKRKSCPGCLRCQQIHEDIAMAGIENVFVFPKDPKHGDMYEAKFVAASWDGSYVDSWYWELTKVEEG